MSRHFLPGCCRAVGPAGAARVPVRLLRPQGPSAAARRPAAALDPGDLWRTGRAAERAGPKGGCPERRGAPRAGDENRKRHEQGKEGTKRYWAKRTRRARE